MARVRDLLSHGALWAIHGSLAAHFPGRPDNLINRASARA
ncbi:hypothetical protein DVDV_1132 [Desulfovibrio sp. DV]|nr:hypothetical protein DVDV_1132 [Desulfovibrio sp. DV]